MRCHKAQKPAIMPSAAASSKMPRPRAAQFSPSWGEDQVTKMKEAGHSVQWTMRVDKTRLRTVTVKPQREKPQQCQFWSQWVGAKESQASMTYGMLVICFNSSKTLSRASNGARNIERADSVASNAISGISERCKRHHSGFEPRMRRRRKCSPRWSSRQQ